MSLCPEFRNNGVDETEKAIELGIAWLRAVSAARQDGRAYGKVTLEQTWEDGEVIFLNMQEQNTYKAG